MTPVTIPIEVNSAVRSVEGPQVSEEIPLAPDSNSSPEPLPRACNISRYYHNWKLITKNSYVLRIINQGYKFRFSNPPRILPSITSNPHSPNRIRALKSEISRLLNTGAISKIKKRSNQFCSRVFTVLKPNGNFRLILDLSHQM